MRSFCLILSLAFSLLPTQCKKHDSDVPAESRPVKVVRNDQGKWQILVGNEPYYVNGASTNHFFTEVGKFGGNTIRLYSPNKEIMDDAYNAGLMVYLGLGMKKAESLDYTDVQKVAEQKEAILEKVRLYMNHPALLCWSIGNEIESRNENNIDLWKAIGDIAESIDEIDGRHPITCALAGASKARIKNLVQYAPKINILSINSYYPSVGKIGDNLAELGIDLPYLVTEFGPRGTWVMGPEPTRILPWKDNFRPTTNALVEETSTEKETIYLKIWEEDIKAKEDIGCLGSFVFLWGYQTHGEVLNWYATYTVDHYSYGACDAMQKCWTGEWPATRAPRIESRQDMTMNGKTAESMIRVLRGSKNTAKVSAHASAEVNLHYRWIIFAEGDHKADGSMPDGMDGLIADNTLPEISFTAPSTAGGYRLYVFVLDDVNQKAASACIPFYVE